MKLSAISVCHMQPEIISFSIDQALRTIEGYRPEWIFVDHHWPIDKDQTSQALIEIAGRVNGIIIKPDHNLGAHGGFNFALQSMGHIADDDLIVSYDPDSNPITHGWLKAMVDVMQAAPHLTHVSLMPSVCVGHRSWLYQMVAGHRLSTDQHPEMINVTIWKGSFIRGGMKAPTAFYGGVEAAMFHGKHAYLHDYREDPCPILHPWTYTLWKDEHAQGRYAGNFDQWFRERGIISRP